MDLICHIKSKRPILIKKKNNFIFLGLLKFITKFWEFEAGLRCGLIDPPLSPIIFNIIIPFLAGV